MRTPGEDPTAQTSGWTIGYVRVSAADQNPARQVTAVGAVTRLYEERQSGKTAADRPVLQEALSVLREGDTLRVKSPDRLARSTRDLLDIIATVEARGAAIEFVDSPALNTDSPQGRFTLTILGAVAELERATIRERQAEGIAAAKARGVYNRAPALSSADVAQARQRAATGVPKAVVARDLGVSRATLYKALSGTGVYATQEHPRG